jgi:hypothetical protein
MTDLEVFVIEAGFVIHAVEFSNYQYEHVWLMLEKLTQKGLL